MIIKIDHQLNSIYSSKSLLEKLVKIQLEAIQNIANKDNYRKAYRVLLYNFDISNDELQERVDRVVKAYKDILEKLDSVNNLDEIQKVTLTCGLNFKWYNTLKHTLYIMEPDLIKCGKSSQVYQLWDWFFQEDIYREETFIEQINLIKI